MTTTAFTREFLPHSAHEYPSLEKLCSNAKRHAIYIPQSFFDQARQALITEADAASTWEFSAPISPSTDISESSSSLPSSPAQELVVRYRAGMPIQLGDNNALQLDTLIKDQGAEGGDSTVFYTPVEEPEDLLATEYEGTGRTRTNQQRGLGLSGRVRQLTTYFNISHRSVSTARGGPSIKPKG
jgi:hypothetical protein